MKFLSNNFLSVFSIIIIILKTINKILKFIYLFIDYKGSKKYIIFFGVKFYYQILTK